MSGMVVSNKKIKKKTNDSQNWKVLRMTFSNISKIKKLPPRTPKIKIQKIKKLIEGGFKSKEVQKIHFS